jgi:hypothetical protein
LIGLQNMDGSSFAEDQAQPNPARAGSYFNSVNDGLHVCLLLIALKL